MEGGKVVDLLERKGDEYVVGGTRIEKVMDGTWEG